MAEIKRPNYFTSQFLEEGDFQDEQSYHMSMRRRHNRAMHRWGVVEGLQVSKTAAQQVSITPGMAVDNQGREIVLPADPAPPPINPGVTARNTDVFITIAYADALDAADAYTTAGVTGKFKKTTERPELKAQLAPPTDGSVIILARVSVAATGDVGAVDNTARTAASSVIAPGTDLEVRSLKWGNNSRLQIDQGGSIELGGDNATAGTGTPYIDFHFNGKTEAFNARIINDGDGRLTLQVPVVRAIGNVGIGIAAPSDKLDVAGNIRINDQNLFLRGGGDQNHAIGWFGGGKLFAGAALDGPAVFGFASGALGTTQGGQRIALHWNFNGNIGIGNSIPSGRLQINGNADQGGTLHLVPDTSKGPSHSHVHFDPTGDWYIRSAAPTGKVVIQDTGGNVGIGTAAPTAKLQVTGGAIMPAIGNNEQSGIQFPPDPGVGAGDRAFIRYYVESGTETTKLMIGVANDADDTIGFTQFGAERMTISGGNVGIGTATAPGFKLDVGDRMRVRQGGSASAGIWLFQNTPAADRAFIGMAADNQVGLWGSTGAGWGLVMDTTSGSVGVGTTAPNGRLDVANLVRFGLNEGGSGPRSISFVRDPGDEINAGKISYRGWDPGALGIIGAGGSPRRITMWDDVTIHGKLAVDGPKTGYIADQFVNNLGEALEQGDLVVIGNNQTSLYYGTNDNIPIPEADLTETAYDTRVCGIVAEVHATLEAEKEQPSPKGKKTSQPNVSKKRVKGAKIAARAFTDEEMRSMTLTSVAPNQIGLMVTLGTFAHCKVDADVASIKVGDLLTTSTTRGHAQKVLDPSKATGAIIGKALGSLKKGKGKIPILVSLQ